MQKNVRLMIVPHHLYIEKKILRFVVFGFDDVTTGKDTIT
jgi:hypothetical protein